ncbi:MAG: hypothetical protein CMJ89_09120 [Planctomycetes bacterium]|nr:hypothetical protein [Planctomycetota bacterium]
MKSRLISLASLLLLAFLAERPVGAAQVSGRHPPLPGALPRPLYTAEQRVGTVPLLVTFRDLSKGDITAWHWKFGDGTTSSQQNPTHLYTATGTFSVTLTASGPAGMRSLRKQELVRVGNCSAGSARFNTPLPLELGADFIPVAGDDSLGFYCVYSGKRNGLLDSDPANNVGIFLFDLGGDEVLLYGAGYGDVPGPEGALFNAEHDAHQLDDVMQWCMGMQPSRTQIRFVAPHGHPDHINPSIVRELEHIGYTFVDIFFHEADTPLVELLSWTPDERRLFRPLAGGRCGEELLSFDSPLGPIWFYQRPGHTPGSIDLVLDTLGDPENRVIVLGSVQNQVCPPQSGVRETITAHGNVVLDAPAPILSNLSPQNGTPAGGSQVTLLGANFLAHLAGLPQVSFGGTYVPVEVLDDTTLVCRTPQGTAATSVDVRVVTRNGSSERPRGFTYNPLPILEHVAPSEGTALGGTLLTLKGSGFLIFQPGETTVTIGGSRATDTVVVDDRTLTCKSPLGPPNETISVSISNKNGTATLANAFRYRPLTQVRSLNPIEGTPLGGTHVTIRGSGFQNEAPGVNQVWFDGVSALDIQVVDDETLTCTTPGGTGAAAADVKLTNLNGATLLMDAFLFYPNPDVNSVTPGEGPPTGGTDVAINGTGFEEFGAGPAQVHFGGIPAADVRVLNDTRLRCIVPPGQAGELVEVTVSNDNGTGTMPAAFRYEPVLTATSFVPSSGSSVGGTWVSIEGQGFEDGTGDTLVFFGGVSATNIQVLDDTRLTCIAPGGTPLSRVDITLQNALGTSNYSGAFLFHALPSLTGIAPLSGPRAGGTHVLVLGEGFQHQAVTSNEIFFDDQPAAEVLAMSDNLIRCMSPAGRAGESVDVTLRNFNGEATLSGAFRYNDPPEIVSIDPQTVPLNTHVKVAIEGRGFQSKDAGLPLVRFDQRVASNAVVLSDTLLTCTSPRGLLGRVDVSVENQNGLAILRNALQVMDEPLTLRRAVPSDGIAAGGTLTRLEGSGFRPDQAQRTTVSFGGKPALDIVIVDGETIECRPPPGEPNTSVAIEIRCPAGYVISIGGWRYRPVPTLDSLTPASGPRSGGEQITLRGHGFFYDQAGANVVLFGSAPATDVLVLDDSLIHCTNPQGLNGGPIDVTVRNANGESTLADAFLYKPPRPQILTVSPAVGSSLGGTSVTLSGKGFSKFSAAPPTIRFGTEWATAIEVLSDTSALCLTPAGPSGESVSIEWINNNGETLLPDAFGYHPRPVLQGLNPSTGNAAGGTQVTLMGSGFLSNDAGVNLVSIGTNPASNVAVISDTQLTLTTPPGTPGLALDVSLSNANGEALSVELYSYFESAPTLTRIDPPSASTVGPAPTTLTGTGFLRFGATPPEIMFGELPASDIVVHGDTALTCLAPIGTPGEIVNVTLQNSNGAAELSAAFRYHALPRLTGVAPDRGTYLGSTLVTLDGSGFLTDAAGENSVRFAGAEATEVTPISDSQLTCLVPPGVPGLAVSVELQNANGGESLDFAFTYNPVPTLLSVSPTFGDTEGRTRVTLRGSDFSSNNPGMLTVLFGGSKAHNLRVIDPSTLECDTPTGDGPAEVEFVNNNGSSKLEQGFLFGTPSPTLDEISPDTGTESGGTLVTITGSGFSAGAGLSVRFDGASADSLVVLDDETLTCLTPPHVEGAVDLELNNDHGSASMALAFMFLGPAPTISSIQPQKGPSSGGTPVTLLGTGFIDPRGTLPAVTFGGQAATQVGVNSDTELTCLTPSGSPSTFVAVVVENARGHGLLARAFRYTALQGLNSLDPPRGPARGDTPVLLTGEGFDPGEVPSILVGGVPASDVQFLDAFTLSFRTPPGTPGKTVDVGLESAGASAPTLPFHYDDSARDLDADGEADRVVALPEWDELWVVFETPGATSRHTRILGPRGSEFATAVQVADLTQDGIVDLIATAPGAGIGGEVYLFPGPIQGTGTLRAGDAHRIVQTTTHRARSGTAMVLSDLDCDGELEWILGAPGMRAVQILPSFDPLTAEPAPHTIIAAQVDHDFGSALAALDVDGDGYTDWLASAPGSERGGEAAGAVLWFAPRGRLDPGPEEHRLWVGDEPGARFGHAIGVGSLGGSNALDLAVSAPSSRRCGSGAGAVALFYEAFDPITAHELSPNDILLGCTGSKFGSWLNISANQASVSDLAIGGNGTLWIYSAEPSGSLARMGEGGMEQAWLPAWPQGFVQRGHSALELHSPQSLRRHAQPLRIEVPPPAGGRGDASETVPR